MFIPRSFLQPRARPPLCPTRSATGCSMGSEGVSTARPSQAPRSTRPDLRTLLSLVQKVERALTLRQGGRSRLSPRKLSKQPPTPRYSLRKPMKLKRGTRAGPRSLPTRREVKNPVSSHRLSPPSPSRLPPLLPPLRRLPTPHDMRTLTSRSLLAPPN